MSEHEKRGGRKEGRAGGREGGKEGMRSAHTCMDEEGEEGEEGGREGGSPLPHEDEIRESGSETV